MAIAILALIVSFIPPILFYLFLKKDPGKDEEYRNECRKLLVSGLKSAAIVCAANLVITILWNLTGISESHPLVNELFKAFIVAATVEECAKFLIVRPYFNKNRDKLTRMDVLVYLSISALSFGLLESVVYLFSSNVIQILVKGILMGHVGYGLIMGLLYGKGLAEDNKVYRVLALLIPVFLHGLYDFSLNEGLPFVFDFIAVTGTAVMTIFIICMIFFIRKKRNDPAFNTPIFHGETDTMTGQSE